jgi:DNA integrity scanning protein DisA with diadenylate cyclase activity
MEAMMNDDLPKTPAPAARALAAAGYNRLSQLTQVSERELQSLHGMGPKAIKILRDSLAERGLSFRSDAGPS